MVSTPIQERIDNLIMMINKSSKKESILLCKKESKYLLKEYSLNYATTCLTEYKKQVGEVKPSLVPYLSVGKKLIVKKIMISKKRRNEKNRHVSKIINYEKMIEEARSLLESEKYSEIALGLCFLTGRRLTEVLKTAKFSNYKRRKYMVNFEGQLKKKQEIDKYPIYILGNYATECKSALKKIRAILDTKELSNKEVERKYHTTVNQRCMMIFKPYIGRCTAHNLRAAYAAVCSEIYRPKTIEQNLFLSGILGHNWSDTDTASSYKKYII